ncbi:MAG: alpha/beta hydrolase [Geobacteraceae bacterium]|nr:alpha/beta hydrolase [Geobacteraceae bacterium]NTW81443.1 alpha/beta hydrolase [Geobacteraceae bacterium]
MPLPAPTIVIPGITASYLQDEYPLPPETVWSVLTKEFERISLHPKDLRYEAVEPARVTPGQIYEIAYKELVAELRHNLTRKEEEPVPVYPFSYDWRMPLNAIQERLKNFVDEVIARTKLMRHYVADGYETASKVNLIGHSMGGLIIAGYLQQSGKKAPINKVVTLASPFQGSFEAVIKVITGTADLGTSPPSSREREAARLTPALYHLLPSFLNAVQADNSSTEYLSLFEPKLWQSEVLGSIEQFVRLHGLPGKEPEVQAVEIFTALLAQAKEHRAQISSFRLNDAGLTSDKWLAVVGVGSETRVRMKLERRNDGYRFDLSSEDRQQEWDNSDPKKQRLTGDGTVPYEGAIPPFLDESNLVLVTPDDFGYWEVQDRLTCSVAGFHGILPNMDMLHRLIVRFITGSDDKFDSTWGRPAPGVSETYWKPPLKLKLKK